MSKNKSVVGFNRFLKNFYKDLKNGIATGWWNERYNRKGERLSIEIKGELAKNPYEVVELVKKQYEDLSEDEIDDIVNSASRTYMLLNRKRVYFWEVKENKNKSEAVAFKVQKEDVSDEELPSEEDKEKEDTVEEDSNSPDFDHAKTLDKSDLKDYAATFDIELDARKSKDRMIKSFQGAYHAKK